MSTGTFDRLIALMSEREEHDPLDNRYAYLSGRIDECCHANGIKDADRDKAKAAVQVALRGRRQEIAA